VMCTFNRHELDLDLQVSECRVRLINTISAMHRIIRNIKCFKKVFDFMAVMLDGKIGKSYRCVPAFLKTLSTPASNKMALRSGHLPAIFLMHKQPA
jgi:hypothetical protein